jgi:predicted RNase H-like HicB family nuclease
MAAGRRESERADSCFDSSERFRHSADVNSEIIFEVTEAEEGGYCATALGFGINTQAETLEGLRAMVRDAVDCYFDNPDQAPKIIRLHFVRDEVLAR